MNKKQAIHIDNLKKRWLVKALSKHHPKGVHFTGALRRRTTWQRKTLVVSFEPSQWINIDEFFCFSYCATAETNVS